MITDNDRQQLAAKGISEQQVSQQLTRFAQGFPYLRLHAAASTDKGIAVPSAEERRACLEAWDAYTAAGHTVVKFVPASGAASRMFKDLFAFLEGEADTPQTDFVRTFFARLADAPFRADLDAACLRLHGKDSDALTADGRHKDVVAALLGADGLGYGSLPKGLLKFHRTPAGARTPLEEHLVEGALYARSGEGDVHLHFTVSPEHKALFEALVAERAEALGREYGARFHVDFSTQKPSTDTVAVTPDNDPFRTAAGELLFRPGGHGALIENLNDIAADIIFIKTVDNVAPDRLKPDTVEAKRLLAGMLVRLQQEAFGYLRKLDSGRYTMDDLLGMLRFVQQKFCCKNPETKFLEDTELAVYLRRKLNRPIRVCGMVRNTGEPGGGPFLAYNPDGTYSPQILESSQIDMADPAARAMFEQGTHFNPVDLVCAVRNYKGVKFHLPDFVDPATGFISSKSKDGRELKALELPGLWNGAMSDWNTVFVEVPLATFNPVKTVNDLYRPQHQ